MTDRTREDKLVNWMTLDEADHPGLIEAVYYRRDKVRLGSVLCSLATHARVKAMHAYFVEHDIERCKQNFYLAARLTLESVSQDGGASFETGGDILRALLSDSAEVIDAMARVETPELISQRDNPLNNRFHVYMLQLAIRGDDEAVRAMIEKIAKHGKNPRRTECAEGRDFFSLLLDRDEPALEKLIQGKHASMRSEDAIDEDFMSYRGTVETKLCWYRGIPVQIDHPLVPMALMPVQPLDHYDDVYDFLKPGWTPPPQGLAGKLSRWFKQ